MGEAFITRRGGGTPYAVIGVTYPSGSVCTCTNGTLTLTAKGTGGKAIFVIPAAGTWTVKAVKGSKSKSKAVSITADGQVEAVTLAYEYAIFDASGLNSAYSSGGDATVTVTTDSSGTKILKFPNGGGYNRMAYLTPAVDLTNYKTLKISGFATADRKFAVWKTVPDSNNAGMTASVVIKQGTSKSTYTIDVSSLSGSYYLGTQYATGDTTVYELVLE